MSGIGKEWRGMKYGRFIKLWKNFILLGEKKSQNLERRQNMNAHLCAVILDHCLTELPSNYLTS